MYPCCGSKGDFGGDSLRQVVGKTLWYWPALEMKWMEKKRWRIAPREVQVAVPSSAWLGASKGTGQLAGYCSHQSMGAN